MNQREVDAMLTKLETSVEASHGAQIELLKAMRMLFVEARAIRPEPTTAGPVDPNPELAALDEAAFDGLPDAAVFNVEEAAKILRVGRSAVYEMVRQKRMPSMPLGRKIRIPRRALVAFLRGMGADAFDGFIKRKVEERG